MELGVIIPKNMLCGSRLKAMTSKNENEITFHNLKTGRLDWKWLKTAKVGFEVDLAIGRDNAYTMAKKYAREISITGLANGDYRITVKS